MAYSDYKKMTKQAGLFGDIANAAGQLLNTGAMYLLGQGMITAGGAGYLAQKLTAHDKADIDTLRKSYENERLSQDINYLSAKTKAEYDAKKRQQEPKAARVF